ncbi:hypothetical protein [Massilia sp. BKSP1R2A-1]|uniref:hypothetical protein n=1 Tax=Massilia sp. BKSP1R2A-1 TaxID=3422595 RepID=UPI003D331074
MPTIPPTIDQAPEVPKRGVKATFGTLVDAFNTWFTLAATQIVAMGANVYANALEAFGYATAAGNSASAASALAESAAASANNAADSATAASVVAGATLWVSGQSVSRDAAVISPLDRRTYRRKAATGAGTTDPSLDLANYVLLSADSSSYIKLAEVTIGSAVANIDFLNLFSDVYPRYVIEFVGLVSTGGGDVCLRFAKAGTVDSTVMYYYNKPSGTFYDRVQLGSLGGASDLTSTVDLRGVRTATATKSASFMSISAQGYSIQASGMYWDSTVVASGFRLYMSSGSNFTAGTIKIYGVRA